VQRRLDADEEDARAEKIEHEERVWFQDDDLGGGTRAGCRRGSIFNGDVVLGCGGLMSRMSGSENDATGDTEKYRGDEAWRSAGCVVLLALLLHEPPPRLNGSRRKHQTRDNRGRGADLVSTRS
jgi:hypothetical protein